MPTGDAVQEDAFVQLRRRVQLVFLALALLVVADAAVDRLLVNERNDLRADVRPAGIPPGTL